MRSPSFHQYAIRSTPTIFVLLSAIAGLATSGFALVTIEYVTVGNVGNPPDPTTGFGAVPYAFDIGKYEVTNSQYAEFLNAVAKTDTYGLYHSSMNSDVQGGITRSGTVGNYTYSAKTNMGNKPVIYVSWYDAARFANWLNNFQPTGPQTLATTEAGTYTLTGNTGMITRNSNSIVWIPSENEWYKAAYYDPRPGASVDNYWLYATMSDGLPTRATANATGDISNPGANVANYNNGAIWNFREGNLTTVGSAGALSASYYGTFDQAGNAMEWNDAIIGTKRGLRGGPWATIDGGLVNLLPSTYRHKDVPSGEGFLVGFRVASIPVPSLTITALHGAVPGGGPQVPGITITLTATPDPGYIFTGWTGDATGTDNPLTVLMNADKTITADFTPDTNDTDDDGFTNYEEIVIHGTNPALPDTDEDGVKDSKDAFPLDPAETLDTDDDGTGDNADIDDDNDGYSDTDEINIHGTNPKLADSDGDGLSDPVEIQTHSTNPNIADTDQDGLSDGAEVNTHGTFPKTGDTDGDGFLDGYEVLTGKLPLDPLSKPALVADARTAIEFTFPAALGKTYRIEASTDLAVWGTLESGIAGNGGQVQRFYTTRNMPKRYFRVEEDSP